MNRLLNSLRRTLHSRKGQGTVEYALTTLAVVLIIGFVLFATPNPLRDAIEGAFTAASTEISDATTSAG